jgi:hypothetical protein
MEITSESNITYVDGIDARFKTGVIKKKPLNGLTVGDLKRLLKNCNLPDETPIVYENIAEDLLINSGWEVIPMLWEKHRDYTEYSPCIHAFQAFITTDLSGVKALVLTAHY